MTDIPIGALPMEAYRAAREEGKGAGDSVSTAELREKKSEEPTGEEETLKEYKEKRENFSKNGVQKRIDVLTKRSRNYEQENQTLKARLAEFEARNGNGNGQQSSSDADRADSQETREETPASRAADDPRAIAARARFKDFDQTMASASHVRIADEASRELHESPLAAHVSYFIARDPQLAFELPQLSPAQQVQEIRRIETDLMDSEPAASELGKRILNQSTRPELEALDAAGKANPYLPRAIYHHLEELADLSNGPDVFAALAKNVELSQHIAALPTLKAAVAIGRISQSLERDSEEKTRPRVPAPIRPVTGGTTRSTVDLDKASYQDFKRMRQNGRVR